MAEGARCKQVEVVLDEIEAIRHAMARANKGDLVVLCVDKHPAVLAELESWSSQAQAGAGVPPTTSPIGDPDTSSTPASDAEPSRTRVREHDLVAQRLRGVDGGALPASQS